MLDTDDSQFFAALAAHLRPQDLEPRASVRARSSLTERIRQSAKAHLEYRTVRREDGRWEAPAPGLQVRCLHADMTFRVDIVRLARGSALPWPEGVRAQEILVLEGRFIQFDEDLAYAYHVRHRSEQGEALTALDDMTVYVRQLLVDPTELPALEHHWWNMSGPRSGWVFPARKRWLSAREGVEVLPLRGDPDVVSMLVRFTPGATVADHKHALNEDCLVLEGEMFLGDILLRTGDYQLAPAGGSHFGETTDVGVMFFFHGALDPVLKTRV